MTEHWPVSGQRCHRFRRLSKKYGQCRNADERNSNRMDAHLVLRFVIRRDSTSVWKLFAQPAKLQLVDFSWSGFGKRIAKLDSLWNFVIDEALFAVSNEIVSGD